MEPRLLVAMEGWNLNRKLNLNSPHIQTALRLKEQIDEMPEVDVPRRMESYFRQWRDLPSEDARKIAAKAIIRKARNAGAEEAIAGQQ